MGIVIIDTDQFTQGFLADRLRSEQETDSVVAYSGIPQIDDAFLKETSMIFIDPFDCPKEAVLFIDSVRANAAAIPFVIWAKSDVFSKALECFEAELRIRFLHYYQLFKDEAGINFSNAIRAVLRRCRQYRVFSEAKSGLSAVVDQLKDQQSSNRVADDTLRQEILSQLQEAKRQFDQWYQKQKTEREERAALRLSEGALIGTDSYKIFRDLQSQAREEINKSEKRMEDFLINKVEHMKKDLKLWIFGSLGALLSAILVAVVAAIITK